MFMFTNEKQVTDFKEQALEQLIILEQSNVLDDEIARAALIILTKALDSEVTQAKSSLTEFMKADSAPF